MSITVLYFASFQEAAGVDSEVMEAPATLTALFESLKQKYQFKFQIAHIRVAVNGVFVGWQHEIVDGCEIAFIPPVSGG
ncbi:MAG: MoaD/ThiS family protein [Arenimonas sp.]